MQEDLITAEEHEEISLQSEIFRTKAAELLLAAVERSCPLKLLSILKSYDGVGLADRLQQKLEEQKIDVDKGGVYFRFCMILPITCFDHKFGITVEVLKIIVVFTSFTEFEASFSVWIKDGKIYTFSCGKIC